MSYYEKAANWIRGHGRLIRRGFYFLCFLALVVLSFILVFANRRNENNLIADWNNTIRVLGIEPVFPPEEDLYVGDLLAVVISDTHKEQSTTDRRPLLNRAIKLAHVDVRKQLHEYYDQLPVFPPTEERPGDKTKFWPQKPSGTWTFDPPGTRTVLPIAAFPGFVVESQSSASGALGNILGSLSAVLQNSDDTQLQIPFVESYGIPSLLASKILDDYCATLETRTACSDATIREHLGYVSNKPDGYMTETEPDANGDVHFMVQIELALVNRVYLTRSIEQKVGHGVTRSTRTKAKSPEEASPGKSGGIQGASAAETNSQPQTTALTGPVLRSLDADVSAEQKWDDTSNLDEVFERPIAFGYRAVKRRFDPTPRPKLLPGQTIDAPVN